MTMLQNSEMFSLIIYESLMKLLQVLMLYHFQFSQKQSKLNELIKAFQIDSNQ